MQNSFAIINARIFDGSSFHQDMAVVVRDGLISECVSAVNVPDDVNVVDAVGQTLAPGLIDVQVNGGGGVLLNDQPTVEGIKTIMAAHRRFGTTAMLPTLITDSRQKMTSALTAINAAITDDVPGIVGIHLEGPYLNAERKGVHPEHFIRSMEEDAIAYLSSFDAGVKVVTLAPECVANDTIQTLSRNGIRVCAGHSAASHDDIVVALKHGLCGFTHLFNAMSPLTHRAPGVVGAALADDATWCGLIADGYHVHPSVVKIAVRAKVKGKIMLVTDAMPTVGAADKRFSLGGEEIVAKDGRCALANGTLAGSDLDMISAVRNCMEYANIDLGEALRMASLYPAEFLGLDQIMGRISPGYQADMILFNDEFKVTRNWIKGIE